MVKFVSQYEKEMTSPVFSADCAKAALQDIVSAFSLPENSIKLAEAKAAAGNDMLMHMRLVFPLAMQIQQTVIQNYGFSADREGLLRFTHVIKLLEKQSVEVAQLNEDLKSYFMPSVILPYSLAGSS